MLSVTMPPLSGSGLGRGPLLVFVPMRNPVGSVLISLESFKVELESLLVSSSLTWRNKPDLGSFKEKP
jgi:hypothetical protein